MSDRTAMNGVRAFDDAPCVSGPLPWVGAGLSLLRDPTAFFQRTRERVGDTFLVEGFGYRLFCVFSPEGVKSLWGLPEAAASKGVADFGMLAHKVPAELFAGRRTYPHMLFAREDVEVYLENLTAAVDLELAALGPRGELEAFSHCRRLAHRMGLASWGSRAATTPRHFERLVSAFDALDSSESFVHPERAFRTWATGKRREKAALAMIESIYAEILRELPPVDADGAAREPGFFDRIRAAWADVSGESRVQGIARDVVLVHMGSQSNLFAAMAWTLVHLLERPALLEAVRKGDDGLLERCAHESIRLRQRSIVLRRILKPCTLADERASYRLEPGLSLATMMSVTNTSAAPGLERFDPENYRGPLFQRTKELAGKELVSTFGHGAHYCPAARFSISAIRIATRALIERFELEPRFRDPAPLRWQIGGVARADRACRVGYVLQSQRP
ncbi:cytochrome P450 [Myxococcota bacterium]|nr:cytochrome P450 [Myxococcota bacterium]